MRKCLIIVLLCISLTGCWDRNEINDVAIIVASSIDKTDEGKYLVGLQIPLPGAMGGAGSQGGGGGTGENEAFYVDAGVGRNLREAQDDLQHRMSRRIHLGHRRVIVLGEELAREGIIQTIDVFSRYRESRLTSALLIAKGTALNIISANPHLEQLPADAIREIAKAGIDLSVRDFLLQYQQKSRDPILPAIETIENVSPNKENRFDQLALTSLAIFKGDKLAFFTTPEEYQGAAWILGKMVGAGVTVPLDEEETVNIKITAADVRMDYQLKQDIPTLILNINAEGVVQENHSNKNLENVDVYRELEKALTDHTLGKVERVLTRTLNEGIDSFGLGWLIYRRDTDAWNRLESQWREILPKVELDIQVESKIKLPGLTTQGMWFKGRD